MAKNSTPLLESLQNSLENDKEQRQELVGKIKAMVLFIIDGEKWTLDLRPEHGTLTKGPPSEDQDKPDLTLIMNDATFVGLVMGKIGSQQAFLMRKLKINGSMGLAMKLQPILDAAAPKSKM